MKKIIVGAVLLCVLAGSVSSQDLSLLESDLIALFDGIGDDVLPYLQQSALAGDGIGMASMGEKRFFLSTSAGAVFLDGVLGVIDEGNTNFDLLDVQGLADSLFSSDGAAKIYETAGAFFLYPNFRIAMGVRAFLGIEAIATFSILPAAVTGWALGLIPDSMGDLPSVELSRINAGIRLRKVLVEDSGPLPAVSIGAGYTYGGFHVRAALPESFSQDISGLTLALDGNVSMDTALHTAGAEIAVSKRLLFFVPFAKLGAWYQWAEYSAGIPDFEATLDGADQHLDPPSVTRTLRDLSIIATAGFELGGKGFAIVPSGSFDFSTGSFGAGASLRMAF